MTVTEEVPVDIGARLFVCRALHHPRPRALFALEKTKVAGVEERARRVIDQRPSRTRNETLADRLFGLVAARAVEGTRGAFEVFRIGVAGMPDDFLAVDGDFDGEIVGGEMAIARRCVSESERVRLKARNWFPYGRHFVTSDSNFGTGIRRLKNTNDA